MKADKQHTDKDDLLVKYLAGEVSQDESARAKLWIEASESNRKYFEHFKLLWDESRGLAGKSNVDENAAWGRFRERVQKEYTTPSRSAYKWQWLKIAAILLIVAGAGFALIGPYFVKRNDSTRSATPASYAGQVGTVVRAITSDHIKADTLPDGSIVTMNRYSGLNYPSVFNVHNRYVELSGEAFFSVKHDPAKPFVIKTGDLLITVLGTSFNVKSRGDTTEVVVETGLVGIKKQQKVLILQAGEKATILRSDNLLTKAPVVNKLYRSYFDSGVPATKTKPSAQIKTAVNPAKPDSALDFKKHPELLQKILKDPSKWSSILKNYRSRGEDITFRRAVIRNVIAEIQNEKLLGSDKVMSFRLNEGEFIINDRRQPDADHQRFKDKFLKEPGYSIYLGGAPRNGRGVFLSPDSL